jgi:hypothetical protein
MGFYSKQHYERLHNGGPDRPGDAERRCLERAAGIQANAEMMERFAPLTAENAQEAVKWQESRIRELLDRCGLTVVK